MKQRKAFNFYRSYYDTLLKLPEQDRLGYLMAIIEMQFEGKHNIELSIMADLALSANMHSIKKQIEGYKHGIKGGKPKDPQRVEQTTPPKGKSNQVQVQVQEKVQEEKKFNFKMSLLEYGFKKQLVTDWLKVRRTKKATNSQTAFTKFINQVELSKLDKNQILEVCIEKDWKSFNHTWKVELPKSHLKINDNGIVTEEDYRQKFME